MSDAASWVTFGMLTGEDREAEDLFAETGAAEAGATGFCGVEIWPAEHGTFQAFHEDEAALDVHRTGGRDASCALRA